MPRAYIVDFCQGWGYRTISEIADMQSEVYHLMAKSQDEIGWRRFMDRMVSRQIIDIQREYFALRGTSWRLEKWAIGLVTRLLEVTHGQWLYQNMMVHDAVTGRLAITRKEDIEAQIEEQLALGGEDLLEEDQYLMEVNLGALQVSNGEQHEYWLLAIRAAWIAGQISCGIHSNDGTIMGSPGQRTGLRWAFSSPLYPWRVPWTGRACSLRSLTASLSGSAFGK